MARAAAALCLVALVALAFADSAHATIGKGKSFGKGKGISFQTQCQDVCKPHCRMVPKPVCQEVQVPYQDCDKVPVTSSVKRCGKVCTKTTTVVTPMITMPSYGKGVPMGKGKFGHGRHLMTIGKGKFGGKGKGMVAPVNIDCDTVCHDVPVTTFQVQCETKVRTATTCRKDFDQVCEQRCRPVCQKIPVMIEPQPVVYSKGKGKAHWGH